MNENKTYVFDNPDELDTLHFKVKVLSKGNTFAYMAIMILALAASGLLYVVTTIVEWVKDTFKGLF